MSEKLTKESGFNKEANFEATFLQYFNKIKRNIDYTTELRVHGGNYADEIITKFKKDETGFLKFISEELVQSSNGQIAPEDVFANSNLIKNKFEEYFTEIESRTYDFLRTYIRNRYIIKTNDGQDKLIDSAISGNDIYLLDVDRNKFEQLIKFSFLERTGPDRANQYGLLEDNLPKIATVISEEVNNLLLIKNK